jgi:tetratricopeptide (TPR) repeat protein
MIFCADLLTADKSDDAERIFKAMLRSFPDKARVTQGYAVTCLLNGRVSRGLDLTRDLWTRFPTEIPEDMFMVAFQLRRRSRMDDELAVLRFLVREFPRSAFAHLDLAAAHEHYGNTDEALASCAKAIELNPALDEAVEMQQRLASIKQESAGLDCTRVPH